MCVCVCVCVSGMPVFNAGSLNIKELFSRIVLPLTSYLPHTHTSPTITLSNTDVNFGILSAMDQTVSVVGPSKINRTTFLYWKMALLSDETSL